MSKFVICTLAHASLFINGIAFEPIKGGVVSVDPVDDADAERFAAIPGYELADEKPGAGNPKLNAPEGAAGDGEPKPAGRGRRARAAAEGDAEPKPAEGEGAAGEGEAKATEGEGAAA